MEHKIFGCKVNKYYINQWLDYLSDQPMSEDGLLIGSCEVTDKAKNKWLKKLTKALDAGKTVYLSGCGAFDEGESISKEKLYNLYPRLIDYDGQFIILPEKPPVDKDNFFTDKQENIYTRKFIVVQNGCDGACSFCLTTKKRGAHTSRKASDIIEETNQFYQKGGKEINLTGVNMMAWGADNSNNADQAKFTKLLKQILSQTDIPRIRLSSLGPEFIDEDFFKVIQNPRIMPHFHISVQSFSDHILDRMNRNYNYQTLEKIFSKFAELRKDNPLISLGADIMIGFPGEKEKDLKRVVDKIHEFKINKLHVFPFSSHTQRGPDVPASQLDDQLYYHEVKERAREVRKKCKDVRENFKKDCKGKSTEMFLEFQRNGKWHGWTNNYIRKAIDGDYSQGDIVKVQI